MMTPDPNGLSPERIFQVGLGFWASKTLLSAVELDVFTLDALVALGMLRREEGVYKNTPETDFFLDKNKPSYSGGMLEMANARLYPFWGSLTEGLQTGRRRPCERYGMAMRSHAETRLSSRRRFLAAAVAAGLVPPAAALLGTPAASTASAADSGDLPDYAAIPPTAFGPKPNAQGYFVGSIAGNLYWVTDGVYQAMFLTTRDGVVLVDAPPTLGQNLLRAIDEVTRANGRPNQVTHLVYSHAHADHIGAAGLLGADVARIGHRETSRLLRRANDPNRPAPSETFERNYVLRVGGERLDLAYQGPNHSPDNIFIYAPDQQILMVVDVIFPGWVPFKGLAVSQDIPGWMRAQEAALDYPWQTLVGGHLGRLGTRADGELQRQYMADLDASARAALANLDPTPFFQKYGPSGNLWAVFAAYLDAASKQTADPVVAKYTGQLAAADVFTFDNAYALLESLRIDAGVLGPFGIHP